MKKISVLFCIINLSVALFGQMREPSINSVNHQLRDIFSNLQQPVAPHPQSDVLFDLSVHISDLYWWTDSLGDTNTINNFTTVYRELFASHYDTTLFDSIEGFYPKTQTFGLDTIPVLLIDYNFHKLKPDALASKKYFVKNSNGKLTDNFKIKYSGTQGGNYQDVANWGIDNSFDPDQIWQNGDTSSPYVTGNIFMCGIAKDYSTQEKVTFIIPPEFILIDNANLPYYVNSEYDLIINFNDGSGWHNVDVADTNIYSITYPSASKYCVEVKLVKNGVVHKASRGGEVSIENANLPVADAVWTNIPGLKIGVYGPCSTSGVGSPEKFIVILEGFDPLENTTHEKTYKKFVLNTGLGDLRNHGYTFLVVDWNQSTIDMETNADYVIGLLVHLKNNYITGDYCDPAEPFIVMGASMGGIIGRFALTKMEGIPHISDNRPDLMHNTRLFVSMDSPHQGAYIPIGMQHLYRYVTKHEYVVNNFPDLVKCAFDKNQLLDSRAGRQMLSHYVGVDAPDKLFKNHSRTATYSQHNARTIFMDNLTSLNDNNGYPKYCKTFGVSSGLLSGGHQIRNKRNEEMQPGDNYLTLNVDVKGRFLWFIKLFYNTNLEVTATANNSPSKVFKFDHGKNNYKLQIRWRTETITIRVRMFGVTLFIINLSFDVPDGLEVVLDSSDNYVLEEFVSNTTPLDAMPGGYLGISVENKLDTNISFLSLKNWVVYDIQGNFNTNSGSSKIKIRSFYHMTNINTTYTSQALNFCFVPVTSALDYNRGSDPYDYDIYANHSTTQKMANTPFDVIMGFRQDPTYPANYNKISRNRMHVTLLNYMIGDTINSSDTLQNGRPILFMNREIGEDVLYLENYHLSHSANLRSADTVIAGLKNNPYYEYPSQLRSKRFSSIFSTFSGSTDNGIFSKEKPFTISMNGALNSIYCLANSNKVRVFHKAGHYDSTGLQNYIGSNYSHQSWLAVVCDSGSYSDPNAAYRSKFTPLATTDSLNQPTIWVYPNPSDQILNFEIELSEKAKMTMALYSSQGNMLKQIEYELTSGKNTRQINISELSPGLYYLRAKLGQNSYLNKIIIQ